MPPPPKLRAPATLPDDLVEEILLRVPPDDPASLARAALACRRWRRLVSSPAFRRRRLDLHRATPPPLLGVVCDAGWDGGPPCFARFVPTSSCRPPRADRRGLRAVEARHGRVLLHGRRHDDFFVWNPVTDQMIDLPRPPKLVGRRNMKATVLCAAINGTCDHVDCHRGPFIVVLVGTNGNFLDVHCCNEYDDDYGMFFGGHRMVANKHMFSCIYSSQSGVWSEPRYAENPDGNVGQERTALVGNALYFTTLEYHRILKYDLDSRKMSWIDLPYDGTKMVFFDFARMHLTTMEDGRLGLGRIGESSELYLWSRDEDDEVDGWTLCKVIDLKKLFPLVGQIALKHCLIGFVESVSVALVALQNRLFTIDMKSGLMRKVSEGCRIFSAVPYISFCTPALEESSRDDGPRVGASSA